MCGQKIALADAFCNGPFTGNPAAVCILDGPAEDAWMQRVAMEMNQAETAFVYPFKASGNFNLRWFTPAAEVDLCGHATLASAHVLWETNPELPARLNFETRSGMLFAERSISIDRITLDFPSAPPSFEASIPGITGLLGCDEISMVRSGLTRFDALVHVNSATAVRTAVPDMRALAALPVRGVILTAESDLQGADFVSRFFAPGVAVPEDPVTGSAHCSLAPYWSRLLGRNSLVGKQLSMRGGTVLTELCGDRVKLSGRAVTVLRGELQQAACVIR